MRVTLLFENCLFAQLVIDAITHDNKTIIEIFLTLDRKRAHYRVESDEARVTNGKLLNRMKKFILNDDFDTDGYAWSVEVPKVYSREQLLHLACRKSSR